MLSFAQSKIDHIQRLAFQRSGFLRLFNSFSVVRQQNKQDDDFGEDLVQEALKRAKVRSSETQEQPKPKVSRHVQELQRKQQEESGYVDPSESEYTRSWKNLTEIPAMPRRLTYLGLIPLWVLCPPVVRNIVDPILHLDLLPIAGELQMVYAAGILSFLGAVHWGVALVDGIDFATASNRENTARYLWGVIPMLLSWPAAVLLHPGTAGICMAGLFMLAFDIDFRMTSRGMLPPWYMRIRGPVSLAAMVAVTLTFADTYGRRLAQINKEMIEEEVAAYEAGSPLDNQEVIRRFIDKLLGRDGK